MTHYSELQSGRWIRVRIKASREAPTFTPMAVSATADTPIGEKLMVTV
jgi:hypothetical protein